MTLADHVAGSPETSDAALPTTRSLETVEAIFRAEGPRLLRYFNRRVGRDAASDLLQEVFARILKASQVTVIENPAAYMRRIVRNLLIDRARRKKRDSAVFFPLDEERDEPMCAEQTWQIEVTDLLRIYQQVVRAMPPKTRRVFVMHRQQHLTYREISEQIGIAIPTVEYHMNRALALCREAVADHPGI